jgi:hypothetical protein|tara:strand:- start:5318 stop:5482 length:165 start_codon:yes stop_codon:yes gene_type:complete
MEAFDRRIEKRFARAFAAPVPSRRCARVSVLAISRVCHQSQLSAIRHSVATANK